jgi:hypothetical protein
MTPGQFSDDIGQRVAAAIAAGLSWDDIIGELEIHIYAAKDQARAASDAEDDNE